jgi:hypothetical protein
MKFDFCVTVYAISQAHGTSWSNHLLCQTLSNHYTIFLTFFKKIFLCVWIKTFITKYQPALWLQKTILKCLHDFVAKLQMNNSLYIGHTEKCHQSHSIHIPSLQRPDLSQ